jgi:outer membrane protein assembly factor BamE (lipoprotein component of BamABCDE complex)
MKFLSAVAILVLASCAPKVENRGYISGAGKAATQSVDWKKSIIVGQTNKQEILDRFGSPSTKSNFGAETWYYVSTQKEGVAFLKPDITAQEVADIQFDASGVASSVNVYNKDDARQIALINRTTPTEGHSLTFLDQTLGNIGRFNKPSSDNGISNSHTH